ncbi:hypothetical protein ACFLRN_04530 [Thermoproteota archaeon]
MNELCSNFRQKNLNTVSAILRGLKDGNYPSLIARQLGLERNLIHYYIKKLERLDYIEKQESVEGYHVKTRGLITLFHLTQNGSKFLEEIEKKAFSHKIRLHNCYWLYPIVQQPEITIDWRRVELHNWGQLIGQELGLTVRKNTNSVEILTNVLYGDNPYELLFKSRDEANNLASYLEQKFLMNLGRPKLSRKPHFGIYAPIVGEWSENFQLDTESGKIDRSNGYAEIDITDPVSAANFLRMPNRLERIENSLETFAKGMDQHMLLITELRELVYALKANGRVSDLKCLNL